MPDVKKNLKNSSRYSLDNLLSDSNYLAIEIIHRAGNDKPSQSQIDDIEELLSTFDLKNKKLRTITTKNFTAKEKMLLDYLMQGHNPKQIRGELDIKDSTYRFHRDNILDKTYCKTLYQLMYELA